MSKILIFSIINDNLSIFISENNEEDSKTDERIKRLEQEDESSKDRVAALNQSLARSVVAGDDDKIELDNIPMNGDGDASNNADATEEAKKEIEKLKKLQILFKNTKIFLNREVPRESLVFMIRAFGGQVSWDSNVAPGATFNEDDPKITHQICDRPRDSIKMQHIGKIFNLLMFGTSKDVIVTKIPLILTDNFMPF